MAESIQNQTCKKCGETKPADAFTVDRANKSGRKGSCKACVAQAKKARRDADPERFRAYDRRLYRASPKRKLSIDAYRKANRDRVNASHRAWLERNPNADRDAEARWRKANPEKVCAKNAARRLGVTSASVGPVDLDGLWLTQGDTCPLCGSAIDRDLMHPDPMSKSLDHIVPLSKGGTHEQSNLQWAHLVCNTRKGATVPVKPS